MQIAVSLTLLTLLPAVIMCITPFLRITIVLHFLRQALGTQTTPSNQVLIGLVAVPHHRDHAARRAWKSINKAWSPLENGRDHDQQAIDAGSAPLKTFLSKYVREKDVRLFVEIAKLARPAHSGRPRLAVS